jgi:hypothetical protein
VVKEGVTEHEVNFISARWVCTRCSEANLVGEISICDICAPISTNINCGREFKRRKKWSCYNCKDPIEDFVSWLLTGFSSKNPVIIFSHNGGR